MDSPFGVEDPNARKRELTFCEKLFKSAYDRLNDFYIASIPSDDVKAMPPVYMYPIGGLILIILCGIFFGVFLPSYLAAINVKYLEPGVSNSEYCSEVTISNSGNYLATDSGVWIGGENFTYCDAAYVFSIENYAATSSEFAMVMDMVYNTLVTYGNVMKTQDLGVALLFWMTLTMTSPNNNAERFYLSGDPTTVFNRQKTVGGIGNVHGDCPVVPTSTFDAANALLTVQFNYWDFIADPICNQTVTPSNFGYTSTANPNTLTMQIDIRSLITAHSLNVGILTIKTLTEIVTYRTYIPYNGNVYLGKSFVNPNFPGMAPIFCIMYDNMPHCVLQIGSVYGIPIYNHAGSSGTMPTPCDCSTLTEAELNDKFNACNIFNFITGFLFFDTVDSIPIVTLGTSYTGVALNDLAFNASYIASMWGMNSIDYGTLNAPGSREAAYAFCSNVTGLNCSVLAFSSYDIVPGNYLISEYFYSLPNGACRDTISTSPANWSKLIETPFAPLTQSYSECTSSPTSVLVNQAGIAVGNVSLLSPFGVLFVLVVIACYQKLTGFTIPKTYSRSEKDSALDAFAVALLAARDERRKQKIDPTRKGLNTMVYQIVNELADIADSKQVSYKEEEVERIEIDFSAILLSIFGGSKKQKPQEVNRDSNAVEMTNVEAPVAPASASGKITFQKVFTRDLMVLNNLAGVGDGGSLTPNYSASRASVIRPSEIERLSSTAAVRSHLAELRANTDVDELYTETMEALDALIEEFRQAHDGMGRGSITSRISLSVARNPLHNQSSSEHWPTIQKTVRLNGVDALHVFYELIKLNEADRDEDDEEEADDESPTSTIVLSQLIALIYKKIYALMVLHAAVSLHLEDTVGVYSKYAQKVGYSVNNVVLSMGEVKAKGDNFLRK